MPESPRTIALVACASRKLRHAAPARDLYVSVLFAKSRRYAERHSAAWFILSALHGLVDPDVVIEPYDQTLNDMPVAQRRVRARSVLDQLDPLVWPGDTVIVLGGARYRDGIVPALRARGVHVAVPLEGLRIGEQLSFLAQDDASSPCRGGSDSDVYDERWETRHLAAVERLTDAAVSPWMEVGPELEARFAYPKRINPPAPPRPTPKTHTRAI